MPSVTVAHRYASSDAPLTSLQTFVDTLAAGDLARIERNCWTVAPQTLRDTFTEQGREAFLGVLAGDTVATERGLAWSAGDLVIFASWAELSSPFACPTVHGPSFPNFPRAVDLQYLIERLDRRLRGNPVNRRDTVDQYPLLCDHGVEINGESYEPAEQEPILSPRVRAAIHELATGNAQVSVEKMHVSLPSGESVKLLLYGSLCISEIHTS